MRVVGRASRARPVGRHAAVRIAAFEAARSRFSGNESELPLWLPPPLAREDAFRESDARRIVAGGQQGRPAPEPYSGRLMLRVSPEVHAAVAAAARMRGKSIDEWASEVLGRAASRSLGVGAGAGR